MEKLLLLICQLSNLGYQSLKSFPVCFQQSSKMESAKNQAEQLAIANKIIYEQKVRIMELEKEAKKFDQIKSQNQTLMKIVDHRQDSIEKLKSEVEELKLQKNDLTQNLSVFEGLKLEKQYLMTKIRSYLQKIHDLKQTSRRLQNLKNSQESKIKDLENKLQIANSKIEDFKKPKTLIVSVELQHDKESESRDEIDFRRHQDVTDYSDFDHEFDLTDEDIKKVQDQVEKQIKEQEVEERLEDILEERKLQSEITQYIKELSFPDICEHEYADEDLEDFQNQVEKHFEEQGFEKCP